MRIKIRVICVITYVYIFSKVHGVSTELGCYSNDANDTFGDPESQTFKNSNHTQHCIQRCEYDAFKYAATQTVIPNCICLSKFEENIPKSNPDECSLPCKIQQNLCGGIKARWAVYEIGNNVSISTTKTTLATILTHGNSDSPSPTYPSTDAPSLVYGYSVGSSSIAQSSVGPSSTDQANDVVSSTREKSDGPSRTSSTTHCSCNSTCMYNSTVIRDQTVVDKNDILTKIQQNLLIDKTNTAVYRMTKKSASDNRSSSRVMGVIACIVIFIPVLFCVCCDVLNYFNIGTINK